MQSIAVSIAFLLVSFGITWLLYRLIYGRQIAQGGEGNLFVGLMIWAATCLALGFAYNGLQTGAGIDLPPPAPFGSTFCPDGSIQRLDGTCSCSQFDLEARC